MIISIPIKPYLKDFLINMYGQEPIPASKKNLIGILIEPLLQKPPADYIPSKTIKDDNSILVDVVWYNKECGSRKNPLFNYYLGKDDQISFNKGVAKIFNTEFFSFVDGHLLAFQQLNRSVEIKNTINLFCEKNNISIDHANYDMLQKSYYRYRKNKKITC